MIWFTSDTHFGAQRTLELSRRPFSSVDKMDDYMITKWNERVRDTDKVYHLGDFGNADTIHRLNGKIILIKGNYETDNKDGCLDDLKEVAEEVGPDKLVIENKIGYQFILGANKFHDLSWHYKRIVLTHKPEDCIKDDPDIINLFGHIHEKCMIKPYGLNVGVDCHYFKPLNFEDIAFYLNAFDKGFYDNNVFE